MLAPIGGKMLPSQAAAGRDFDAPPRPVFVLEADC